VTELSPTAARQAARLQRRAAALAARAEMSPTGPAPDRLRIATWNLNSLRARLPALERFIERAAPDVLCLQETKTAEPEPKAFAMFERLGYDLSHVGAGPYNGVALATRGPLAEVVGSGAFGDEHLDREPRLISALVSVPEVIRVASVYVPHGREVGHWHYDYKLAFLDALAGQVRRWLATGTSVVVAGDINVAATDADVFHPDAFVGSTHVTPAERTAWTNLLGAGLLDLDAVRWGPRARRFTWWKPGHGYATNLGMRIDAIAADQSLSDRLDTTWIDHTERNADRPSDHAALIADFRR
jgi:exodeoxyribonuclease-3